MKKYDATLHERLRHRTGLYCCHDNIGVDSDDVDTLLDEIERLQTENRWIQVSERLPEEELMVRCYFNKITFDGFMRNEKWFTKIGDFDAEVRVTHWRPFPPAPRNEERE